MAQIVLSFPFDMNEPKSWVGQTLYSRLKVPQGGEFWVFEEGVLADDQDAVSRYDASTLTQVLEFGVNSVVYETDTFSSIEGSDNNVTTFRLYDDDVSVGAGGNLVSASIFFTDISMPKTEFMSYLQNGKQAQLIRELVESDDLILGSLGADTITGWEGNDVLWGRAGNDRIYGQMGSDTMSGGEGDDRLWGDYGNVDIQSDIDYARYDLGDARVTSEDYSVTQRDDGWWVVSQVSGTQFSDDGRDFLSGVERLVFSDVNVALDIEGTSAVAYRLYKAAFDRIPDLGGLGFWIASMDIGVTGIEVAQGFINSAEFLAMYGADSSNADFVDRLYLNILDRPGETAGRNYWINALDNGADRAAILLDFSESVENQANVEALISNGIEYIPFVFA